MWSSKGAGRVVVMAWVVLALWWTPQTASAQDFSVVRDHVGRQYLLVGGQVGLWLGSGTVDGLPDVDGNTPRIGDFNTRAWGIGPVNVGLAQAVSRSVLFELRLGLGALFFEDDRLINQALDEEGESHVGFAFDAELIGRYAPADGGLTAALGVNVSRARLPGQSSTSVRVSPRFGYLTWGKDHRSFVIYEVGYQLPVINGFVPDISEAAQQRLTPIDSFWQGFNVAVTYGF